MKHHILLILLLLPCINFNTHPSTTYSSLPMIRDLEIQHKTSLYRLSILPITFLVLAYFQYPQMKELLYTNPITVTAIMYGISHCLFDTWSKYKKIQQALHNLHFAKTMHYYILCVMAIHNHLKEWNSSHHLPFDSQDFLQNLTNHTTYNLDDLERITNDLIDKNLLFVQDLCLNPYIDKINNELYTFTIQNITVDQILSLSQDNKVLIAILKNFQKDPEQYCDITIEKIGQLIRTELQCFVKQYMYAIPK